MSNSFSLYKTDIQNYISRYLRHPAQFTITSYKRVCCRSLEYGIGGEGSHILTNQRQENSALQILIGWNMEPFPTNTVLSYLPDNFTKYKLNSILAPAPLFCLFLYCRVCYCLYIHYLPPVLYSSSSFLTFYIFWFWLTSRFPLLVESLASLISLKARVFCIFNWFTKNLLVKES